jgi:hypothetical protein
MRPPIAAVREQIALLRSPGGIRSRDSRPSTPVASAMARSDMALAMTSVTEPVPKLRRMPIAWILATIALVGAGITIAVLLAGRTSPPPAVAVVTSAPMDAAISDVPAPVTDATAAPAIAIDAGAAAAPESTDPSNRMTHSEPVRQARTGTVVVTIAGAPRAKIVIDGKVVGTGVASVTHALAPGDHTVRAVLKGYKAATSTLRVVAGKRHDVTLNLQVQKAVNAVHDPFEDEE